MDYKNLSYTRTWFVIQGSGDFTWRVSDCEELSGGYSQEMMGLDIESELFGN